jgi:predicted MPP superfamily phosphohydrolase
MRRSVLAPPRVLLDLPRHARGGAPVGRPLLGTREAVERPRRFFHPRHGWLRRLERGAANFLASAVFPRVPGITRPYGAQLRRDLTLSEVDVALPGLPRAIDGLRVLLLTDVHAGPFVSPETLAETFRRLLATRPDLVLLGGDLATSGIDDIRRFRAAFALLRAPLGTYAVLGNHEYYTEDPALLPAALASAGIRLLVNDWAAVGEPGARFGLAGVDDLLMGRPDLDRALDGAPRPVVLLSHNPDLLFDAARRDVALMLSGHTHAGQIRVPGTPVMVRQSRYRLDEGRFRAGATELVVSRGLGAVGLPLRAACPPEAVLLRLGVGGERG